MPKRAKPMTTRGVEALSRPGLHADGNGLYLAVKSTGAKSWIFRYSINGRRRDAGLGSFPAVSLAEARKAAIAYRSSVADGVDPLEAEVPKVTPTFGAVADELIANILPTFRNEKHKYQWRATLDNHAAALRLVPIDKVDTVAVFNVLRPLWLTMPETASRLRCRIERVLDAAKAAGYRSGDNPAAWRGNLKPLLGERKRLTRGHHAALDYRLVPAFMAELKASDGVAALALQFTVLTAGRTNEVLGAEWSEINLAEALWVVPGNRMKAGDEHRVPLSRAALRILERASALREVGNNGRLVFPGTKRGRPLSGMSMAMLLRRMEKAFTVHGFRSSFRDWAGNETEYAREVAEAALAHRVGDATERAYRRQDALAKRRAMMNDWAAWCEPSSHMAIQQYQRPE